MCRTLGYNSFKDPQAGGSMASMGIKNFGVTRAPGDSGKSQATEGPIGHVSDLDPGYKSNRKLLKHSRSIDK